MQNTFTENTQQIEIHQFLLRFVRRFLPLVILVFLSTFGSGCGGKVDEGPALFPVKGTVTFEGEPVKEGRIQFSPAAGNGAARSAEIKEGAYELNAEPGKMKVEITASRIVPGKFSEPASPDEAPQPLGEMYIPEQYNSKTTLEAEVKSSGDNNIPFQLTSQ
jgi:hypothetical protein